MAKKLCRIKDTSRTYPKVSAKDFAKALGAKHITSQKDKKEFQKKYKWPRPLVPKPTK